MKLKVENGMVSCLYRAGKDMVEQKLTASVAAGIVKGAHEKVTTGECPGFPLCVDDQWFFPVEEAPARPQKKGKKGIKSKE